VGKRIVVDTNILVAAMLSPLGENRDVLRACLKGLATPLVGAALFHEYEDLLARPLMRQSPLSTGQRETLFAAFLSIAKWIKVYYLWRPNLPDEADNHLIELALAGSGEVIVTNNVRDLMHGELRFPGLRILSPKQFLDDLSWQP
jgi:uncharacterized protein